MQDKNLHIDKKFTNQAWMEMKRLLDQELPVDKENNRHPFFWWYSGAAVLAASTIAFFVFFNFNTLKNKPENIQNTPTIISENNQKNKEIINENDLMANNSSEAITDYNQKDKTIEIKEDKNITKNEKTVLQKLNKFTNENNIKNSTENQPSKFIEKNIAQKEIDIAEIKKSTTKQKQILEENNFTEINSTESVQPSDKHEINHLAQIPIKGLENHNSPELTITPTNKFGKSSRLLVYATSIFRIGKGTRGIGAGVSKTIELKNKKWWVETGLGYSYLSQPLSYVVEQDINPATSDPTNVLIDYGFGNENTVREEDNNIVNSPMLPPPNTNNLEKLKLHYLNVPITINRKIGRFFISGGLQTDILLHATNGNINGGLFKDLNLSKNEQADLTLGSQLEQNSKTEPYSNIDLSGIIGGGYMFTKNASVKFSYHHGLIDVLKNNSDQDFNRYFQLSLQYGW